MLPFADNLKKFREARHMTRLELSEASGVSNSSIGYYETDKRDPTGSALVAIAETLSCSIDELVGLYIDKFEEYKKFLESSGEYKILFDKSSGKVHIQILSNKDTSQANDSIEFSSKKDFTSTIAKAIDWYEGDPYGLLLDKINNELANYQQASDWDNELENEFWDELFEKYHRGKKITEEDREKFAAFKKRIVMAHSTPPPSLIHSHKKNISEPKESKDD